MMVNGAKHLSRMTAFMLMVMLLITSCFSSALAAEIGAEVTLNVYWTDGDGQTHTAAAAPVDGSAEAAYWVTLDAAALGQTVTVEALSSDPAYTFYLLDESGNRTTSFPWQVDAPEADGDYAYWLYYAVNDVQADLPILLYVSTAAMPVPEPTEAPTPTPVPEALVQVMYYHADGTMLDYQEVTLTPGSHQVAASSDKVSGYIPMGETVINITVYEDGTADPGSVVFFYDSPAPAEAVIPVYYYHVDGTLLDVQELILSEGTHTVTPNSANVGSYELEGASSAEVTVYADGSASIASVAFTYKDVYVAPAEAVVPVYYYHVDGTLLDMQELILSEGTHTITPNSANVGSYELEGASSAEVTVYADGSASIASVAFTYKDVYVAPAEAVIPVYYYHVDGTLLDMQELILSEGTHTITPNSANVGSYELEGASSAEVTVYADGSASIASVAFTYKTVEAAPVEASVNVHYYHLEKGLLDSQTILLTEGTHIVAASSSKVEGYMPVGSMESEVTVYADGSTHPGVVEFYYEDAYVAPVTAELTILYQLADGTLVASDAMTLTPGMHTVQPDSSKTGAYVLDGEQSYAVSVDDAGNVTPDVISFLMKESAALITVHYHDDRSRDLAPEQSYTYTDGSYVIKAAPEGLSSDYELAPGQSTEVTVTVSGGVASPSEVYFYYQQKQAPAAMATVTVHYLDTLGNQIAAPHTVTLQTGKHELTATAVDLPQGAELVSDAVIVVEVYENGTFAPQEIAFYYRIPQAEEQKAEVTIFYRDDRGSDVATPVSVSLSNGSHILEANPTDLPDGYVLFAGTDPAVEVTVRNGVPSQSQVVFYYQKAQVEPTVYDLPVYYYDTMGEVIAPAQTVSIAPGTWAVQANPTDLPEGYELMMDPVLTVVVHEDGTTEPEEIAFYYRAPEKKATIIVVYLDESHQTIIEPFTMELTAGYHTIEADASRLPGGYDLSSAKPVQVYVSREGEANPAQVNLVFEKQVVETPVPVGAAVYRYAEVNGNRVAMRSEPTTASGDKTVLKRLSKGSKVYVMQELYNSRNEVWAMVNVDGQTGYMMSSYLDIMTQKKSDEYAAGSTPAPTFTPVPTASPTPSATPTEAPTATPTQELVVVITPPPTLEPLPTESATTVPTAVPTEVPTATPTATPTASPSPTPYSGYALTTRVTALRTGISASDMSIQQNLEANELVQVYSQVTDPQTGEIWSIVSTLNRQSGYVQDSALRRITEQDAEPYIDLWVEKNKTPAPTEYVSPTPEPMQVEGYGVVLGDGVPLRQMQSEYARIIDNLDAGTIVYISGQTPGDGQYWHSVYYENYRGYIRTDLVRMMTIAEEEEYLDSLNGTPEPTEELPEPTFDTFGLSSYGYVVCTDNSSVNWREEPSTDARRVGALRRYAFCLVRGTHQVNGVTWYEVSYADKTGYIHGDFFKHMTISELEDFLGSEEYLKGIANNSPSGDSSMDDVGFTGTGGIVSAEDQWVNKNPDVYASFEPFNPIATIAPITGAPTLEPLPGATATPYVTPTPTPTFNPLPDVTYPTSDDGEGGSAVVWVVVAALLLLAVGGVFALVRYQQNRRRIAMRAAQRRAQAARAQQAQQARPYARNAAQGQPRTGTYPNQQTSVRRPAAPQQGSETAVNPPMQATGQYKPYTGMSGYGADSSYRPAESPAPAVDASAADSGFTPEVDAASTQPVPRVGRRTAYRQAQEKNTSDNGNTFDL